jgi:hypothetical protein
MKAVKIAFAIAVGTYGVWGALDPNRFGLLNGADLLLHEGGHVVFGIFGIQIVGILGGTLMQLLIPAAIVFEFIRQGKMYSASIALFWLAQNFFHVSVYIKDARTHALPLVGGEIHDWNFLLSRMGLLEQDLILGSAVWAAGALILLVSVAGGIFYGSKRTPDRFF